MTTASVLPPSQRLAGRDHLSFSSIRLFASCPLNYFFRKVKGLPEETVAASLVFGTSFHAAVECHFRELLAGNPPPSRDALLAIFWEAWHARKSQAIHFAREEDINTMGHLAERMFRAFQNSDFARPEGTIIAVEEELRGELVPGLPDLLARLDLIVATDEALIVTDFKTARSQWNGDHVDEAADQLIIYHELVKNLAEHKPVQLAFAVLTKTKVPELTVHPVPVEPQRVERTRRLLSCIWQAMQAGHYYPSPGPVKCPACPYRQPCREWTG